MKLTLGHFTFVITLFITGCGSGDSKPKNTIEDTPSLAQNAIYEVTINNHWNSENFATNYPSNAHYSAITGLTHNENGFIFELDAMASEGIVIMAETGARSVLSDEISNMQNLGAANYLISEAGIARGDESYTFTIEASLDFPLLSFVSMIAPSPDWFIGVAGLSLLENEQWLVEKTMHLKVYDAGSDSGMSFSSLNSETLPRQAISLLSSNRIDTDFEQGLHFNSQTPIATVSIIKVN